MNLQTPVRQLMATEPVTVRLGAPLSTVRELLRTHPFNHVPVVSERGRLVGILSAADLARYSLDAWVGDEKVVDAELDASFDLKEVMSNEPVSVQPSDSVRHAAGLLADGGFHGLPVVNEDGELVGMLTSTDLLRFLALHSV